jgi:hypothetical protein
MGSKFRVQGLKSVIMGFELRIKVKNVGSPDHPSPRFSL